jgi:hypothetical protein
VNPDTCRPGRLKLPAASVVADLPEFGPSPMAIVAAAIEDDVRASVTLPDSVSVVDPGVGAVLGPCWLLHATENRRAIK